MEVVENNSTSHHLHLHSQQQQSQQFQAHQIESVENSFNVADNKNEATTVKIEENQRETAKATTMSVMSRPDLGANLKIDNDNKQHTVPLISNKQQVERKPQSASDRCAGCREPIMDRFIFSVIDLHWHQDCVQCSDCSSKLDERCYEIDGKLYCKLDYWRRFGPKCFACRESIDRSELVQRIKGNRVYHLKCFTCNDCHKQLKAGEQLHLIDGKKLLCKQDYNQLAGSSGNSLVEQQKSNNAATSLNNSSAVNPHLPRNGFSHKTHMDSPTVNPQQQQQQQQQATYFTLTSNQQNAHTTDKTNNGSKNTNTTPSTQLSIDKLANGLEELAGEGMMDYTKQLIQDRMEDLDEDEEEEEDDDDDDDDGAGEDDEDEDDDEPDDEEDEADAGDDDDSTLKSSLRVTLNNNRHVNHHSRLVGDYNSSSSEQLDNNNLENEENRSNLAPDNRSRKSGSAHKQTKSSANRRKRRKQQQQMGANCHLGDEVSARAGNKHSAAGKKLTSRNGESILNVSGAYLTGGPETMAANQLTGVNQQQQLKSVPWSASTASNSSTSSNLSQSRSVVHRQAAGGNQQSQQQQHGGHQNHHGQHGVNQAHPTSGGGGGGQTSVGGSASHKPTRVRTVLNEKQLQTLRDCYAHNPRPDALMKEQLVDLTGLSPRVIRVWFQNKRCKDKKKSILFRQMQDNEKAGRHLDGVTLMRGVPMVASSPIQYDDHSTNMSTSAPTGGSAPPLGMMELGAAGPDMGQTAQHSPADCNLAGQQHGYAQTVHSPAADVHAYQPPWDNLIEYAQQQRPQQAGSTPPDRINTASPRYKQLIGQIHGYSGAPTGPQPSIGEQQQAHQFATNQANGPNYQQQKHRNNQPILATGQPPPPPMGHLHPFNQR